MHKGFFSLADFPKEGIFISENIPLEAGMFPEDLVSALDDIRGTKCGLPAANPSFI